MVKLLSSALIHEAGLRRRLREAVGTSVRRSRTTPSGVRAVPSAVHGKPSTGFRRAPSGLLDVRHGMPPGHPDLNIDENGAT
jgi:hypothetical protein